MIYFSPSKINLGLYVTGKRNDGYHNLLSVMYPIPFYDIIEILPREKQDPQVSFRNTGMKVPEEPGNNLCLKAYRMFSERREIPAVSIHLHKQIPVGAGLGGGSSNAAITLAAMNLLTESPLSESELLTLSAEIGSDCPFFLYDSPMKIEGKGDILTRIELSLEEYYIILLNPGIQVSTQHAYQSIIPDPVIPDILSVMQSFPGGWKTNLVNDFEYPIFSEYPLIKQLKSGLYEAGALYASMTGSGSSVYGIFNTPPELPGELKQYKIWGGSGV